MCGGKVWLGFARSLEGKRVEWDGDNNVKQVKQAMVERAREVCSSVRVGGKDVWKNTEKKRERLKGVYNRGKTK